MFLDKIVAKTCEDLEVRKREYPLENLQLAAARQATPRDLLEAFEPRSRVHLIAEVKRASPSKGMLAPDMDPVAMARTYESNGAAAISVLTEPHFFLGSPHYLTAIKSAVNVPVLRKDFIFDEYQVYEARAWGADAILLICAILDDTQLRHLLQVANDQRMRCLVEAHSQEEARRAVEAGAVIIGVNSRDLATFEMHPHLIRDIRQSIPTDRVVIAESGIHTAADARRLARYDVQGMLVGESLVVSQDVPARMRGLIEGANDSTQVKICGLRTTEHIDAAIEAGADMLGFIFHEASHRYVEPEQVRALLAASERYTNPSKGQTRPDIVGVFVNKDADYINDVIEHAGLNFVQLHGNETSEFCRRVNRPVIRGLSIRNSDDIAGLREYEGFAWRILLDTPSTAWGGTGETHDWKLAGEVARKYPILLAGGLTPQNVAQAIAEVLPWGVDVSSGVETDRQKDTAKIRAFIAQVRTSTRRGLSNANTTA
jgi:indole-3-glycerol phosphate synthase / phosphoribosylanthranilate isomerase